MPITEQDRRINSVPGNTGAPAIQLYFSYFRDDDRQSITEYRRIKILNDAGRKYADVEIVIPSGAWLAELHARTVHPDGTTVDFKGEPFEKTILKARGFKFTAKAFALPEVTPGSIVEYQFKLAWHSQYVHDSGWPIQSDLYTVKALFRYRAVQGYVETYRGNGSYKSRVAYAYLNQVDSRVPAKKGDVMELELGDIAPFEAEDNMPPQIQYKPAVQFYYGAQELASPEKFWSWIGTVLPKSTEQFLGNSREVREKAAALTSNESDSDKKLRKLYDFCQTIRNLSSEPERNEQERKKENLQGNRNAADVLAHGYGTADDVSGLFVALARAAGFDAYEILVSERKDGNFNRMILSLTQLGHSAAAVTVNGKDMVLDPGTRFNPYGSLPWRYTSVQALKIGRTSSDFITTPGPGSSAIRREAKVSLSVEGNLRGEVTVEMTGDEALEHRLDALDLDAAGRNKMLEDEFKSSLPAGTSVKVLDSRGWESASEPLLVRARVEIPNFAAHAGKRLISPSLLFANLQKEMFRRDYRRYPIVFPFPFSETDRVCMKIPAELSIEQPPYNRKIKLAYGGYQSTSTLKGDELTTERSLQLTQERFEPEAYQDLKEFFAIVLKGDEGTAVLTTSATQAQN